MKAVLIATDYIKTSTGEYKVLETNTNASLAPLELLDTTILEWNNLKSFIESNGFASVNVIYPGYDSGIRDIIKDICENQIGGITFNAYETTQGSVTVPYIEDASDSFTIRISYDTTAIIDSDYAADKYNFVRALGSLDCKPKSYIVDVVDDFVDLTEIVYTEGIPNFIVKKRYSNYDKYVFPKLYEIKSVEELNDLKTSINGTEEFIQEYLPSELIDNTHSIIRGIDLLYGGNLDIISLGGYKVGNIIPVDVWETTFEATGLLAKKDRAKYITYTYNVEDRKNYIVDVDEDITMADGSIKLFDDIVVGDQVKSIGIPGLDDDEVIANMNTWTGSFQNFSENFYVTSSQVVDKIVSPEISDLFIKITFEDGSQWDDNETSHILVKEGDNIRFKSVNDFVIGDVIECIETINYTLVHKTISNLSIVFKENIRLGEIDVEAKDVFLPLVANNLAVIQHNACNVICQGSRGKAPSCYSFPQCNNCAPFQCNFK